MLSSTIHLQDALWVPQLLPTTDDAVDMRLQALRSRANVRNVTAERVREVGYTWLIRYEVAI